MSTRRGLALWAVLLALALGLGSFVPPMQSPDEHSHILRADTLARGQWLLDTPKGESTGGRMDESLLLFVRPWLQIITTGKAKKLTPEQRSGAESLRWSGREHFFPIPGTGYYLPVIYAPHAIGLGLGRLVDLSIADSYRLVRLLVTAASLALLVAAARIARPPPLALGLLLLPMTLFQLVQPTLDGITTALGVFALALFVRRALDPAPVPRWHAPVLAASLFVLATSRVHLAPLLLLPLWFAWRERSQRDAAFGAAAIAGAAAWTLYALKTVVDARVQRAESTGQLAVHYLLHPWEFVRLVAASFADDKLGELYSRSFIGVLGWLDTYLALPAYPALWIGLAVLLAISFAMAKPRQAMSARVLLLAMAMACVLLIFFALLVTWTPHPAKTIEGVQGRYFIVPALAVAYAAAAPPGPARRRDFVAWAAVALFAAVSLYALMDAVTGRYH